MSEEENIIYGKLRFDETFQYRSIKVNGSIAICVGDGHKLHYKEWCKLGIKLSEEWEHISTHVPERNILMFRRLVDNKNVPNADYLLQNEYEIQKYKNREI
ncbi:hypothetical protein WA171_006816 [Blastocystis sp. BT1]